MNKNGFGLLGILIAIAIISFLSVGGFYTYYRNTISSISEDGTAINILNQAKQLKETVDERNQPAVTVKCLSQQRGDLICPSVYDPVCALVSVQCIKAPCSPIEQTFGNACEACRNSLVEEYRNGECKIVLNINPF